MSRYRILDESDGAVLARGEFYKDRDAHIWAHQTLTSQQPRPPKCLLEKQVSDEPWTFSAWIDLMRD